MAVEVFARHIKLNPIYAAHISWDILQHPEVRAACDEACPDHMTVRKNKAIGDINKNAYSFHIFYSHFADDYEIALTAIKKDPSMLKYTSKRLRNTKQFVLEAVICDGNLLEFVSDELKNDIDVVTATVFFVLQKTRAHLKQTIWAIYFIGESIKNNKQIAMLLLELDPASISYMSEDILKDPEINAAIQKRDPPLTDTLITDKEALLEHIAINPLNYRYGSPELRADKEVLFAALKTWVMPVPGSYNYKNHLFKHIPDSLLYDKNIAITALKCDGDGLSYFQHFNNDPEVVLVAIAATSDIYILKYASAELINDRDFILKAVLKNCDKSQFLHSSFLHTKYVDPFIKDPKFIDEVLSACPQYLTYFLTLDRYNSQ